MAARSSAALVPASVADGSQLAASSSATSAAAIPVLAATLCIELKAKHAHLSASETAILSNFQEVLNAEGHLPPSTHGVEHFIETQGWPVTSKFRRLDATKLAAAKAEFASMEAEGIVE